MFSNIVSQIPLYLLSLPIVLLSLSVHETAHGFVAYRLGDPTAHSMGRLTLNPLKHIDPFGFICMILFHVGWAKPVPINTRYFKKPRVGMALTAAAGPLSNLLMALLFAGLLRLDVFLVDVFFSNNIVNDGINTYLTNGIADSMLFKALSVLGFMLRNGVILNISLAIFNLIPIPPFDGSRIAHLLLPAKWYFAIMRYEKYSMIVILVLFIIFPSTWLPRATGWLASLILRLFGMGNQEAMNLLNTLCAYIVQSLSF